jgi:hypothetical protein
VRRLGLVGLCLAAAAIAMIGYASAGSREISPVIAPALSPDGSLVAWRTVDGRFSRLMVARTDGSTPREVTHWPAAETLAFTGLDAMAWLPDSRRIVFGGAHGILYLTTVFNPHPVRIGRGSGVVVATDGTKVAFTAGNGPDVHVVDLATRHTLLRAPPLSNAGLATAYAFSRDGGTLYATAFEPYQVSQAHAISLLRAWNLQTGEVRTVQRPFGTPMELLGVLDTKEVVSVGSAPWCKMTTTCLGAWAYRPGRRARLVLASHTLMSRPAISGDGTVVAWGANEQINVAHARRRKTFAAPSFFWLGRPSLDRAGRHLAYVRESTRPGDDQLWMVDLTTGVSTRVV